MSSASPLRITPSIRPVCSKEIVESLFVEPLRFAGFWSAITLPFVLLSLVVVGAATQQVDLFAGLLGANLVALRLGRNYNRD